MRRCLLGLRTQGTENIGILMHLKKEMSADFASAQEAEEDRKAIATIVTEFTRCGDLDVEVGSVSDVAEAERSAAVEKELAANLMECRFSYGRDDCGRFRIFRIFAG